jgi:hypothetical protein
LVTFKFDIIFINDYKQIYKRIFEFPNYTIGNPAAEFVVERVDTETAKASIDEPIGAFIVGAHPLE